MKLELLNADVYLRSLDVFVKVLHEHEPEHASLIYDTKALEKLGQDATTRWEETMRPGLTLEQLNECYTWPGYLTLMYRCWEGWTFNSAKLVMSFLKHRAPELQDNALILADGFGATSMIWAQVFPQHKVVCHIMGEAQLRMAHQILNELDLPNVTIDATSYPIVMPKIVAAFETFEHFMSPCAYADTVLNDNTKVLTYSAPFNVREHGHLREYEMNGEVVPCAKAGRRFAQHLKAKGFKTSAEVYGFSFFNAYPRLLFRKARIITKL